MNSPTDKPFTDPAGTWNQRFETDAYVFGKAPNRWLQAQAAPWKPGQRVLCVADGEGRNSVWLAQQGLQVDAFDIAEVGVAKARTLAAEHGVNVNFSVNDCDGYEWRAAAYDGVVAIFVQFADPALRERMFAHMVKSLKPGGLLVLQGYTLKQLDYKTGGPGQASHLYSGDLLRTAFAELEIVTLTEYEAELNEGHGHRGMSALVGMVARKPAQARQVNPT